MLESQGSPCLSTWPKTDTCQRAASELAKRSVQASGPLRKGGLVRDLEYPDSLLHRRGGRPRHLRTGARTHSGLRDSRYRMRESPQDRACHILVCLYRPNKDCETLRRCHRLQRLGRCYVDRSDNAQWRPPRLLSARDNDRRRGCRFVPETDE